MRRRTNKKRREAFTLLEVLLVAGILAVLAAVAIPKLFQQAERAKIDIAKSDVGRAGNISKQLELYKYDMGEYPEELEALFQSKEDADDDRYNGPYLDGSIEELKDPWGNPYSYRCPGEINEDGFDLWSWGPDGKDDEGDEDSDDIKNWIDT